MAMTATVLQDLVASYPSLLDRHELRPEKYGMWAKGIMNANNPGVGIISSDVLDKAKVSWGRNVDIPVMQVTTPSTGTGLACTASGTEAVSAFVNATWASLSVAFEMQPAKNYQNEIKYMEEYARKYSDAMRVLAGTLNAAVDTALAGVIKTSYNSPYIGAAGAKYGLLPVSNHIQVPLADRPDFFNDAVDIMADDDIFPMFDVIGSTNMRGIVSQLFAQGDANATNTQYQFTKGDYNFVFDKDVTLGATTDTDATGYIMPTGAYGIISRNSPDCIMGNSTSDGKEYGTWFDSTIGLDLDYMFYSTCADINALSGNAADVAAVNEVHQFAVHYAILTPYEGAQSGVIGCFDLLTA